MCQVRNESLSNRIGNKYEDHLYAVGRPEQRGKTCTASGQETSGVIAANSAAAAPIRSRSAVGQRKSMRKFCPSRQPSR
jgi:hypothetical protein